MAFLQLDAAAAGRETGGNSASAQSPDAGGLVVDAWHGHADHTRRIRRFVKDTGGARLPRYRGVDREGSRTGEVDLAFGTQVVLESGTGRGRAELGGEWGSCLQ